MALRKFWGASAPKSVAKKWGKNPLNQDVYVCAFSLNSVANTLHFCGFSPSFCCNITPHNQAFWIFNTLCHGSWSCSQAFSEKDRFGWKMRHFLRILLGKPQALQSHGCHLHARFDGFRNHKVRAKAHKWCGFLIISHLNAYGKVWEFSTQCPHNICRCCDMAKGD